MNRCLLGLLLLALAGFAAGAAPVTLYVAPNGRDAWSGRPGPPTPEITSPIKEFRAWMVPDNLPALLKTLCRGMRDEYTTPGTSRGRG